MKKNIAMRVASLVLMCTIVTSCFVSSTFAKYTSEASGSDTVTVAKWDVTLPADQDTQTQGTQFKLFNTILDTATSATDADVAGGLIAPGTKGSFTFDITNKSDVAITYDVAYSLYYYNGEDEKVTLSGDASPIKTTNGTMNGRLDIGSTVAKTATVTVDWEWAYDGVNGANDERDMALAGKTVYVDATVTATQVD